MVWKVWAPAKCKFFMWIMLQDRVWTADRLMLREWPNCYFCQLCLRNLETGLHLFTECRVACFIWSSISAWSRCPGMNPANRETASDLTTWFFNLVGNSTSTEAKGARSLTILVAWSIWCERNSRIFYDAVKTPSRIVEEIKETARLWVSAGAKHLATLVDRPSSE